MTVIVGLQKLFKVSLAYFHFKVSGQCFQFTAGIYLLKVNNKNTRTRCEIRSKLTILILLVNFIVNFEHISHLVLVFLLLTLKM